MVAEVKEFLGEDWKAFEKLFAEILASRIPILNKVNDYLIGRSGKQLRPMLCLLAARLCAGRCTDASVRCAVASEMIHTATLLHDDVADGSDTRRGAPTVSALMSPTASVLVGDYWLSRGVITLIDACEKETLRYFSECLGELAEGEMFQIEKAESLDTTLDDYIYIIAHKTSSLFRAAMKSGARNVGCSAVQLEAVDSFAYHLGLAFQMRDDILDYSPALSIGKPTGQDILERKITLPLLGAFAAAGADARAAVVAEIAAGRFEGVLPFVLEHGGIEYAQQVLEQQTSQAVAALSVFPDSPAKRLLTALAQGLCLRNC
ncbi:MAG: polyprenyl synthetase family protein [Bacteroidales bacterium]|nr:polyprenyl synthetase family protein [Bacteroidales bacterium]